MSFQLTELATHYQGERYPGLPRLDYMRRWLDGLMSIIEGYLMTFSTVLITIGISFSMFDFLANGTLLNNPTVFQLWAGVQVVAVDAQFVNMWYRLKVSIRNHQYWQAGGYLLLGLVLAFVTFGASTIPAIQKSLGIGFDQAIFRVGIDPLYIVYARSSVAILLAIIGAFQRTVIHFDKTGTIKNLGDFQQAEQQENVDPVIEKTRWTWGKVWAKVWPVNPQKTEEKKPENQAEDTTKNVESDTSSKPEIVVENLPIGEEKPEAKEKDTDPEIQVVELHIAPAEMFPNFVENGYVDQPVELSECIEFVEYGQANTIIMVEQEALPEISLETDENQNDQQDFNQQNSTSSQPVDSARSQQTRYAPIEAAKLEICKKNGVTAKDIKKAIGDGKLRANLHGLVSKNAVETWVKNRQEVAA